MRFSMSRYWDEFERDIRLASAPEAGYFTTLETRTVHWHREVNENGDVIYRRMSQDEVEAMKSNLEVEGNK